MSWTDTTERPAEAVASGEDELSELLESPFTPYRSETEWSGEAGLPAETASPTLEAALAEGPFVSPFTAAGPVQNRSTEFSEVLAELMNPELSETIGEVVQEISGIHAEHLSLTAGEVYGTAAQAAELAASEHLEVLGELAGRYLETLAGIAGERDASTLGEDEISGLLESFEQAPLPATESPAFENFLGALGRTVGRAVRAASRIAKGVVKAVGSVLPIGVLIRKLKALVAPLLRRVLGFAINRLPVALRPVANRLRAKLFGSEVAQEDEVLAEALEVGGEYAAVGNPEAMALEFNAQLAEVLTSAVSAEGEDEDEYSGGEFEYEGPQGLLEITDGRWSANEIDTARIRLIGELATLRDGESAAPAFENFLPAVLPVLRLGITVVGRGRVVNFLAGLLAKLLNRFVGPQLSRPLSQAIVDAGLRVLTLETPTAQQVGLAGPAAVAAVAEDTVRALNSLPAEAFEDPVRLELETVAAFNDAVAHNFPPAMMREDLPQRESPTATSMWAMRPRVYWYKKYTKVFDVEITPQRAAEVQTFGGVSLAGFLRAVHGVTKTVKTQALLYETLPGTYLSRISALERDVPYMKYDGWRRFHPLSAGAAGILLSEPGLGRDVDAQYLRDRSHIACGQRFYYLTLPVAVRGGGGQPSQAFVTIDGRPNRNVIVVFLYLSEADAQPIASRARQNNTTAFVIALRAAFGAAVRSLRSSPRSRVTILRETPAGETEVQGAVAGVAAAIGEKLLGIIIDKLTDAALRLATDYARAKRDEFVSAVDDPRSGVTIILTIPAPGLSTLLRGGVLPSLAQIGALRTLVGTLSSSSLLPRLRTVAGFRRS